MNFELKVQAPHNAPIVWNFDELKAELSTALADYSNRVYTEDMLAEAKADSAKLNKLKKAIDDERIARKKEYMKPFETFEDQAKELCTLIETASSGIKNQLDSFEQKRIGEKTERIKALYDDIISNYDFPFLTLEKIFNEKWLNKGATEKSIAKEIVDTCEKIIKDLEIIKRLPYAFEAEAAYKETLDLNKALVEGERMEKIAEAKKVFKNWKTEEKAKVEPALEISFKATLTREQAIALSNFCQENGIVLIKI